MLVGVMVAMDCHFPVEVQSERVHEKFLSILNVIHLLLYFMFNKLSEEVLKYSDPLFILFLYLIIIFTLLCREHSHCKSLSNLLYYLGSPLEFLVIVLIFNDKKCRIHTLFYLKMIFIRISAD